MVTELEYASSPIDSHGISSESMKEKVELMVNCFDQLEVLKDDHEHFAENVSHIKLKAVSILETICDAFKTFEATAEQAGCKIIDLEYENSELRSMVDHYKELSENFAERVEKLKNYLKETEKENQTLIIQIEGMHQELYTKEYQRIEVDNEFAAIIERLEEENRDLRAQVEKFQLIEKERRALDHSSSSKGSATTAERLDDEGDTSYQALFDDFQDYKAKAEKKQKELEGSLSKLQKQLRAILEESLTTHYKARKHRCSSLPSNFRKYPEQRTIPPYQATRREPRVARPQREKTNESSLVEDNESRNLNELAQRGNVYLTTEEADDNASLNFNTPTKDFEVFLLDSKCRKDLENTEQRKVVSGFRLIDLSPALPKDTGDSSDKKIVTPELDLRVVRALTHPKQCHSDRLERNAIFNCQKKTAEIKANSLKSSVVCTKPAEKHAPGVGPLDPKLIQTIELRKGSDARNQKENSQNAESATILKNASDQSLKSGPLRRKGINAAKLGFLTTVVLFTILFLLKVSCNTFGMLWKVVFHRKI